MSAPVFRPLDDVEYGVAVELSPTIRRVIAENPSKFTYRGTGTYLIGHGDVVVVDPGPELDSHRDALRAALDGERVAAILITHCHSDHVPLARWLSAEYDAPTYGFGPHPRPGPDDFTEEELADEDADEDDDDESDEGDESSRHHPVVMEEAIDYDFVPDVVVADGDELVFGDGLRFTVIHTPGHTSNHVCYAYRNDTGDESALFSGDHVMGWSTTVVSPPDGDMGAYIESLRRVARRDDRVLYPTHGPPREDGPEYIAALVDHRLQREAEILAAIGAGHQRIREIVELLYANVAKGLHKPARRSVWGHLVKLVDEGRVVTADGGRARISSTYLLPN